MSCIWLRRAALALASAFAVLLAGCGSGTIESQLQPVRIIAFGDGMADLGQTSNSTVTNARYTVNDSTTVPNIWTQEVAFSFGLPLTTAALGGQSYATGNARINVHPDAAGNSSTPTIKEQIDTFLAANTLAPDDLVIVSAGTADVVAEVAKFSTGGQTSDQAVANAQAAGRDLATQVRRLVQAGGAHVVVAGTYNLSKSPWGSATASLTSLLSTASTKFNEELLVDIVDLGANVLYVDEALQFNLMSNVPTAYGMINSSSPVCTLTDPGPGIGIGAGQVNSALCTPNDVVSGAIYTQYLYADQVYPTPQGQRSFGDYAYLRIRARW